MSNKFVKPSAEFGDAHVSEDTRDMIRNFDKQMKANKFKEIKRNNANREKKKERELAKQENQGPAYRDRYNELKEYGMDIDYTNVAPSNYDELTAEETKILGGDLLHTHLVKGLDEALLIKKREELNEEKKRQIEEETKLLEGVHSIMAKNIQNIINHNTFNSKTLEYFGPDRNIYEFKLNPNTPLKSVPLAISHSKFDCPDINLFSHSIITDSVLNTVSKSMKLVGQSTLKRHKKTQVKETMPIKPVDEDVDIFSDVEEDTKETKTQQTSEASKLCSSIDESKDNNMNNDIKNNQPINTSKKLFNIFDIPTNYIQENTETIENDIDENMSNTSKQNQKNQKSNIITEDIAIIDDSIDKDHMDKEKLDKILAKVHHLNQVKEQEEMKENEKKTQKRQLWADDGYQIEMIDDPNDLDEEEDDENIQKKLKKQKFEESKIKHT